MKSFRSFIAERKFKTKETAETQSTNPKHSESRFEGSAQAVTTLSKDTPKEKIKGTKPR